MRTGDCFEAAARELMKLGPHSGAELVHAEVCGQGELAGITLGHAWVEVGGVTLDYSNGKEIEIPAELYRAIGNVDAIGNEYRYTWTEAMAQLVEHEHWGPWDLETAH